MSQLRSFSLDDQLAHSQAVLDHLNAHPKLHSQMVWTMHVPLSRKVRACVAGRACALALSDKTVVYGEQTHITRLRGDFVLLSDGSMVECSEVASKLLGVGFRASTEMFAGQPCERAKRLLADHIRELQAQIIVRDIRAEAARKDAEAARQRKLAARRDASAWSRVLHRPRPDHEAHNAREEAKLTRV